MASRAANLNVCFDLGATWLLQSDVRDDQGIPLDFSAFTGDDLKVAVFGKTKPASLCKVWTLDDPELTLAPTILGPVAGTGSFAADDIVPSVGAGFDDLNVRAGDTVTLAGFPTNDGDYLAAVDATSNDQIQVTNTDGTAVVFTIELATGGTITVTNSARWQLLVQPPTTYTVMDDGDYRYDVRFLADPLPLYEYSLDGLWTVIERSPSA